VPRYIPSFDFYSARFIWGVVGFLAIVGAGDFPCSAQMMGAYNTPARFIEPPRMLNQKIRDAERAVSEDRASEAVVILGDLLTGESDIDQDLIGQDFLLDGEESQRGVVNKSMMRTVRDKIGLLVESSDAYELHYGAAAEKLLQEASNERDWHKVAEVRRRYFHTQAGYRATGLMAMNAWSGGRAIETVALLEGIVNQKSAKKCLGDSLVSMYLQACLISNRESVIESTDPAVKSTPMQSDRLPATDADDYPFTGRTPARNGSDGGQFPLSSVRWDARTTPSPRQDKSITDKTAEFVSRRSLPPPTAMPIRVGNQVLMRSTEQLVGIDLRSGKQFWSYPWQSPSEVHEETTVLLDEFEGEQEQSDVESQRVWNDVPYGQVSSDGKHAYMIDNLSEVDLQVLSQFMVRGQRQTESQSNTLVAVDLETEGMLVWRLGKEGDPKSPLANSFFLGPPLPVDGLLYVIVETGGDIELVCLQPETGGLVWRQHLVSVESGGVGSDGIRRVSGAMPSEQEGILICPTGAGSVVAVDRYDRTIRWAMLYGRSEERFISMHPSTRDADVKQLYSRWDNSLAVIEGSRVLLTAAESERIFGFDLFDGRVLFLPKSRSQMLYLAGVRQNRFLLVGPQEIRAFDLDSGAQVWASEPAIFGSAGQVCGRGFFDDSSYYVPTIGGKILRVSLADGKLMQERAVDFPLGNMIVAGGEVIVQSPTRVSVAQGESSLRPWVARQLEADENDLDALLSQSQLQLQDGDRKAAVKTLDRARKIDPENIEVQILSIKAMLATLRDEEKVDPKIIETLDDLIIQEDDRIEFLSLRIRAAIDQADPILATKQMTELSRLVLDEPVGSLMEPGAGGRSDRSVTQDAWMEARAYQIHELATKQGNLQQIEKQIQASLTGAANRTTDQLVRLRRHLSPLIGASELRLDLVRRHLSQSDSLAAERALFGSKLATDQTITELTPAERRELAQIYFDADQLDDVAHLADLDPASIEQGTSSKGFSEKVFTETAKVVWPKIVEWDWPEDVQQSFQLSSLPQATLHETVHQYGTTFRHCDLVSKHLHFPLSFRFPDGRPYPIEIEGIRTDDEVDKQAIINGGVMVVQVNGALLAVDLYRLKTRGDFLLWSIPLSPEGASPVKLRPEGTPFGDKTMRRVLSGNATGFSVAELVLGPVLGDRVITLRGGELSAWDLETGKPMWRNGSAPIGGSIVSDGKKIAVVTPTESKVVLFDAWDGRVVESRNWDAGKVWASCGKHVLAYRPASESGQFTVSLIDPISDKVILEKTTGSASRSDGPPQLAFGRVIEGRVLGMMDHTGKAWAWDLLEATSLFEVDLQPEPKLSGLNLMTIGDRLIFMSKRSAEVPQTRQSVQLITSQLTSHRSVDAIHAISMSDGKVAWTQDLPQQWGCTVNQPQGSPLLILTRSQRRESSKTLEMMAIRTDTGEIVAEQSGRKFATTTDQLITVQTLDVTNKIVSADIGLSKLDFRFVDKPTPAEDKETSTESDQTDLTDESFERAFDQ
jgi:outer membrane protein assembly factor BamB